MADLLGGLPPRFSRRGFGLALAAVGASGVAGCVDVDGPRTGARDPRSARSGGSSPVSTDGSAQGRLAFRPPRESDGPGGAAPARTGELELPTAGEDASCYLPRVSGGRALRLVLLLHGAGGNPARTIRLLQPYAEDRGLFLVAPKSRAATWDVVAGGYGPDVRALDGLLEDATALHPASGFTIAGFSDGASYALSLGLTNGDVFDSVVAFSPGFAAPARARGRPRLFVSHGTEDQVLPIERCSRRLVPRFRRDGYDVTYEEFVGGHEVPPPIRVTALDWLEENG